MDQTSSDAGALNTGRSMTVSGVVHTLIYIAAFGLLYYDSIIHTVSNWNSTYGSHGPLILAISCYLVWLKRHELKALPQRPALFAGSLLAAIGCFMLFAGKISSTMLLQQVSMVPTLLGVIWLLRGWDYVKALLIPVGYLIFMTGLVETLLSDVAIYFQLISAWIASGLLELTGMPVVLTGTIVALPHISLEVVKECSGISHIVSLMALSVPLAIMSQLTPVRKLILVIASFFIGIFANGVRIASIGIYAIYNEGADLHGPNETFYVTFIFFFGMVVLIFLSQLLSRKKVTQPETDMTDAVDTDSVDCSEANKPDAQHVIATGKSSTPWVIFGMLFFTTLGFSLFYKIVPVQLQQSFDMLSTEITGFSSRNLHQIDDRLRPFVADNELLRLYVDSSGNRVEVYVGYFEEQTRERKLIDYRRNWLHEEVEPFSVVTSGGAVTINQTRFNDRFNPSSIYFWYIMDDRIITSQYVGKFYTFLDGLFKRRTNGAVIVVQTRSSQEEVMPFLEELVPEILRHLGSGKDGEM